jgi:hypothetical protein
MLAPFATLAFLTALWVSAFVVARILGRSGNRILAALRGETPAAGTISAIRTTPRRAAYARRQPMRGRPQLRAAA